jgi:hypothetical protein
MKHYPALLALAAAAFAGGASAQTLKPGLWEITNHMKSGSGQMEQAMAMAQQHMAAMPPEKRRMIEEMLAKQGVQLGAGGPGSMSSRTCLTKEMVERDEMPTKYGECTTTSQSRSGNTMKFAFTCTQPPSSGEGTYTFLSPEAYTVKMTVQSTVQGKRETMTMDGTGRWLGADCGNIKPLAPPRAK